MVKFIYNKAFFCLLFSIVIALPFIIKSTKVETVDNVDYFLLKNHPDTKIYEEFKSEFGNDEFFIISFKKEMFFTFDNLIKFKKISDEIESLDDVRKVRSLASVDDTIGFEDFFVVEKFLEKIPSDIEDLKKIKKRATSNNLYAKNIVSIDGTTVGIVVFVYERPLDSSYRKRIIQNCKKILEKYSDYTGKVYFAGWTMTNYYLSSYMKKDMSVFIPVSYLFVILAIFFFFRSITLLFIAIANISLCMGSTMGLFYYFDIALNNITIIVPPIVMALALCDTIHIFSFVDERILIKNRGSAEASVKEILSKLFLPCFLTSLTTAVGFASLSLSTVPPVREFSIILSIGMIFEFFFAFTFLPSLLLLLPKNKVFKKNIHIKNRISSFLSNFSKFIFRYDRKIFLLFFVLFVFSIWGSCNIRVETNLMEFFKKTSDLQKANFFVEKNLAGISTLDIYFKSDKLDDFKNPSKLLVVEKVQNYINSLDGVDKTLSFVDFLKDMNSSFHNERKDYLKIPDNRNLVSQYLLLYDSSEIEDYINTDYNKARISIRLSKHSTIDHEFIINKINRFISLIDDKKISITITGRALQDVNTIDAIVKGQIYSVLLAFAIVIIVMFFVLGSFKLGCLSLLPNIFPIVINFGIMGLFSIPLNTATALISAVAIGIAVDDTIHFLLSYKDFFKRHKNSEIAIKLALKSKGSAITFSSIILAIGFGVMVFSSFVPTIYFGLLSAIIMLTALIGDIVFLPSAVSIFYKTPQQ